jgi:putative endonuclease
MNREGAAAELAALYFLKRQGMTPLTSNFRSKLGEIDIIMLDGQILVFVEVRRRSSNRYGGAAASISAAKKKKLWRTAQLFLQQHPAYQRLPCRFDVVAYEGRDLKTEPSWLMGVL